MRVGPLAACVLISVSAVLALPVSAEPQQVAQLDTLVIQGGKRDVTSFDFLQSIDVVGQPQLELDQAANLGDALENLANVELAAGPRSSGEEVIIRGIDSRRIVFIQDGARQNFRAGHRGVLHLDPQLIKQIEVIKGPSSVLWGSGAIGGVVSIVSKDATDLLAEGESFGARLRSGYQGAADEWQQGASIFGQGDSGWHYLLDVAYRDGEDIKLGSGEHLTNSALRNQQGLLTLGWDLSPEHQVKFKLSDYQADEDVPSNPANQPADDNPLLQRETQEQNISLHYNWLSDSPWFDVSFTAYRYLTEVEEDRIASPRRDRTEIDTLGLDLRNTSRWRDWVWQYGVEYYQDDTTGERDGAVRGAFPNATTDLLSVYWQGTWQLTSAWQLEPGLRYDRFTVDPEDRGLADEQDDSEWSFSLGSLYQLTPELGLYASYGEAFRAPSANELFVSGTHFVIPLTIPPGPDVFAPNEFVPNPNLRPERAENVELGLRFNQGPLQAKATVFRNRVEDFIDQTVDVAISFFPVPSAGSTRFDNITQAELEGFELELAYDRPTYYLRSSYGQTRGRNVTESQPLNSVAGDKWVLDAGVKPELWGVRMGARVTDVAEQDKVVEPTPATPGYTLLDLYLQWTPQQGALRGLQLNAGIDNVTDRAYRRHLAQLDEAGRNIKVSVNYRF